MHSKASIRILHPGAAVGPRSWGAPVRPAAPIRMGLGALKREQKGTGRQNRRRTGAAAGDKRPLPRGRHQPFSFSPFHAWLGSWEGEAPRFPAFPASSSWGGGPEVMQGSGSCSGPSMGEAGHWASRSDPRNPGSPLCSLPMGSGGNSPGQRPQIQLHPYHNQPRSHQGSTFPLTRVGWG